MGLDISADLVDRVRDIAERAGKEILVVYNTDFSVEKKSDFSPVTEADQRAERLIIDAIRKEITTAYPLVAEEEVAAGALHDVRGTRFWLIDPLDGTKQFVKREGEFTVNIALIEDGRPLLGVVLSPATGDTYWGSRHGAYAIRNGGAPQSIRCRPMPEKGIIAVASRSHRTPETDEYLKRYDVADVVSSGSSIKFCMVASGAADIYPRMGRTMEWDTAAGHAVVMYAGGTVTDLNDNELTYGKPNFENPHFIVRGAAPRT